MKKFWMWYSFVSYSLYLFLFALDASGVSLNMTSTEFVVNQFALYFTPLFGFLLAPY